MDNLGIVLRPGLCSHTPPVQASREYQGLWTIPGLYLRTQSLSNHSGLGVFRLLGELVLEDSILDVYASRDANLADLNLCLFAANYHVVHSKLVKRRAPVIVRSFPNLS